MEKGIETFRDSPLSSRPSSTAAFRDVGLTEGEKSTYLSTWKHQLQKGTSRKTWIKIFFLLVAVIVLLSIFIIYLLTDATTWIQPHCGESIIEAKSRNCQFDIMHYAWVPLQCFHEAVSEPSLEFLDDFPWYTDAAARNTISTETVVEGEQEEVWTTYEFRAQQCTYGWKIMSHALKTRNLVDDMSGSQEYSHECAGVILRDINDRSLRTNETSFQ